MNYPGTFLICYDPQEEYSDNVRHLKEAIVRAHPSINLNGMVERQLFLVSQAALLYKDIPVDLSQFHGHRFDPQSEASIVARLGEDRVFGDLYNRW